MSRASRNLVVFALVAATGCSGGLSLGRRDGSTSPRSSPSTSTATAQAPAGELAATAPPASAPAASPSDATLFAGLTADASKKNARDLRSELRLGKIGKLFAEDELVAQVTAICGATIWEGCEVGYTSERDPLGWTVYAFRRKGDARIYRYPDMFFDKAEPRWSELAVEHILMSGDHAKLLVQMTQNKCGMPFSTGCRVRAKAGDGFVLTRRDDGEVIDVMRTLREWRADL